MKLIGITQRIEKIEGYHEVREQLDVKWGELLLECGYTPIMLSSTVDIEVFLERVPLHGIILTGGNDLSSLSHKDIDQRRDSFEKRILEVSIKKNIPILGVCRGMQVIGEFFGAEISEVKNHIAVRHEIDIMPNTVLYQAVKREKLEVNSYHKYSVKKIDEEKLTILARSKDQEIEAILHKEYPIMAQMWHPEREWPFKQEDRAVIKALFT